MAAPVGKSLPQTVFVVHFSVEKRYLSVELSTNCLVFDDRIVEASFPGSIRQKAVNCLFNDKIFSFV